MALVTKSMVDSYNATMQKQDSTSALAADAKVAGRGGRGGNLRFRMGDKIWFVPLNGKELDVRKTFVDGGKTAYFTCTVLKNEGQLVAIWESTLERSVQEYQQLPGGKPIPTNKRPVESLDPLGSKATNMWDFWQDHMWHEYEIKDEPVQVTTRDFNGESLIQRWVFKWTDNGIRKPQDGELEGLTVADVTTDAPAEAAAETPKKK